MVKKLKNSIKKPLVTKSVINEVFKDQRTGLDRLLNEVAVQKLIKDMIEDVESNDNLLTLRQIYTKFGILPTEFDRLREKSEDVENAFKFCKMIISIRRECGALQGKLNAGLIERSMPMYDDDWKKLVEWRADLQSKTAQGYQTINVQMNPIPNSDLVPVRKVESIDEDL